MKNIATVLSVTLAAFLTSGCLSTAPVLGGSKGNAVTGSAGGATAQGENSSLEKCESPLGTMAVFEDTSRPWWQSYRSTYPQLGSTLPVVRLMIQQSNCFVVVERGLAMRAMEQERKLAESGQLRESSNFGQGQMVSADYTVSPSVQFAQKGTGGVGAVAGALLGSVGSVIAGGLKSNEAATTLLLIDNRSGVQVSAATGSAKNFDMRFFGGLFGGGFAGAGGYTNTPEGKIVTAAFVDSYNQMVKAVKNYKGQTVEGGLGTGGKLDVQ